MFNTSKLMFKKSYTPICIYISYTLYHISHSNSHFTTRNRHIYHLKLIFYSKVPSYIPNMYMYISIMQLTTLYTNINYYIYYYTYYYIYV